MFGSDLWNDLLSNGGHLVRRQTLPPEQAILEWKTYYDLSPDQVSLVMALFDRRKAAASLPIALTDDDRAILTKNGTEGLVQARELFAAIQIEWGSAK